MDWISDKLYYAETGYHYIGVLDLSINKHKMLITDVGCPYDTIVDPIRRYDIVTYTGLM